MSDSLIEAEGVRVRYDTGERWVGALDLRIGAGEVVLLLGPSGCGKSTLALTLNGLVPHSAPAEMRGSVRVAGTDTARARPGELCTEVGMVFQDPDAQIICGTLLDEVCFGLENLLVPLAEIEPRAMAALTDVGLAHSPDQARRDPTQLSGGQRQKLALACALAMRPRTLVLDEPTANLDPVATRDFYRTLADAVARGTGVVLIEHDLDDAVALADRVVVLDSGGVVRFHGTPAEVFGQRGAELAAQGVCRPTAIEAAERLGLLDGEKHSDPPLTIDRLAADLRDRAAQDRTRPRIREPAPDPRPPDLTAEPLLEVADLAVRLGETEALRGVTLSVAPGDYLAVAGVNGAGKSTLAACLAGVRRPPPGRVRIGGRDLASLPARKLSDRVGFVFQNPEHQFLADTVAEELAHGLRVRARTEAEITARVDECLDRFDLGRYRDLHPFMLSHGEKRRLSVGTALICGPELLVLDEPTFGQDRARGEELLALLDGLHAAGTTMIIVSHDLQLVADRATHVALLAAGELLAHGPTAQVLCDDALLERAGLRPPPVRRLAAELAPQCPDWQAVYRLADLEPR